MASSASFNTAFPTLAVFLPGGPGEFTRGLPLAIITSVIASLLVSLTLVPFLASRFLKTEHNARGNIFMRGLKRVIHTTYAPLLDKALRWPKSTLLIALLLFVISIPLFSKVGFKLFPDSENAPALKFITYRMPAHWRVQFHVTAIME